MLYELICMNWSLGFLLKLNMLYGCTMYMLHKRKTSLMFLISVPTIQTLRKVNVLTDYKAKIT